MISGRQRENRAGPSSSKIQKYRAAHVLPKAVDPNLIMRNATTMSEHMWQEGQGLLFRGWGIFLALCMFGNIHKLQNGAPYN